MATTTSIIVLLKFFAGRQNSALIDFAEFCDYLKRYSEHHLEEQPTLVAYLGNTADALQKELEPLALERQILLLNPAPNKQIIVVIPFFIEKFSVRYKEIANNPTLPFPQESDIPKRVPNEIVTRKNAAELINQLLTKEVLNDKYLYSVVLPHDAPAILLPSTVSVMTLLEDAISKIRTMLAKEEHHDYFLKKLTVSNPGREMTAKGFFNRFVQSAEAGFQMIKQPDDGFYFLTQLCFFIKQDYEKVKDFTPEDLSVLQSIYIIEIVANFFKNRTQENSKKENALKNLEQNLNKPPYYFTFDTIRHFTNNAGVPLLGLYSDEDLTDYLHSKSTNSEANELPELLVFQANGTEKFFIFKNKVLPLILRLCSDARITIRESIKKHWFSVLKNFDDLPEIHDQAAFEKRLEKEVEIQSPILYALLNASYLSLISYENENDENPENGRIKLFENGQLIPYSEILLMNRQQLYTDSKILLPFWYSIPIVSWLIKMIMRPPKAKKPKQRKTSAQIYHEKEAENSASDEELAGISKNPTLNKKLALREAARNVEASLVPSSSTIDRELQSYEHQWNKLLGKETRANLTEDVNALIRDYTRKVLRSLKPTGFTPERIQNLAETLVNTPSMQKIGEKDALMMYIQLFIVKLVKNIPV